MIPGLISCIVPVFNGERYLQEALESILNQTYQPLEVIVADDGSTDGTAALVVGSGERLRYLWQPNAGPAAARNLGLQTAQGEFIAFLDADDLWHPEKLARQMARFQAQPELGVCVTYIQNFWLPELRDEASHPRHRRLTEAVPGYVTQTLLARRTLFDTVGPFNIALRHGDVTEWFLQAAEQGVVMELLPDVLVYRRLHWRNSSRLHASGSIDEYLQILKASLDRRHQRHQGRPVTYQLPVSAWSEKTQEG